jgi:hypothetical protein
MPGTRVSAQAVEAVEAGAEAAAEAVKAEAFNI